MVAASTKILPTNVLNTIKRSRAVYALGRRARFALGSRLGARTVPGVPGRTHYNDFMLTSPREEHVSSYRRGALQFVDILERSLGEAGRDWSSIDQALEIGCGYGRIIRELTSRLDPSKISVCDVISEGAEFTRDEFGVRAIPPIETAGKAYDKSFDLVYLLSVYTHLNRDMVVNSLRLATEALKPGGVIVFTIHGQWSADTCERYDQYWLDKWKVQTELAGKGYYYERYPYYYDEYGLTWFTRPSVEKLVAETAPDLRLVSYHKADVDGHQDVFVYRKA